MTYGDEYEAVPRLPRPGGAGPANTTGRSGNWVTLRVAREEVRKKDGTSLPDWEHVEYFILVGTNPAGKPPVFKNLRWSQ